MRTAKAIPLVSAMLLTAGAAAAALPEVRLAEIAQDDLGAGWGAPQKDGDVSCRVAAKGGRRMFPVKAWWAGESLRPPEGSAYVLEVRYKDTATAPVVFYSHGGIGRYGSPSEVHRFGGSGDGAWKTARVAVGWDQVIRLLDKRDRTAFGVSADADLPVAGVKVRQAAADDEARHNAETRAWIAAAQAEKRKATPLKLRPPQFAMDEAPGPVVAFSWPALVPLLPDAQPRALEIGAPVKVRMCRNELEGGAFGVYAHGRDLTNVRYEVSELTGPPGKLAADVIRRTAEYALVRRGGREKGWFWFPQRLWPAYAVDIPRGRSHWFVFNLRTHRGKTKPGTYKGAVTVTADQGRAKLPVEVEVLPVDLLTMEEAGLFMGGCVTGLVPAHDIDFAVDYNQNGTNLWFAGVQPGMKLAGGKLVLDFTYLDEWMSAVRKRGLKGIVYFQGGCPYGYPQTMTLFREMGVLLAGGDDSKKAMLDWCKRQSAEGARDKPLPGCRMLAVEFIRQTDRHARARGWPEIIWTPFDEPAMWVQGPFKKSGGYRGAIGTGPWIKTYFKDGCQVIREAAPAARIYGSIHHVNYRKRGSGLTFIEDVDVFCTNAEDEDPKIGEKVRAAGNTFWQYRGVGNGCGPDSGRLTFGFYFASFDSRGSLCWAYNWGRGYDTTEGSNWMYAWHTAFDTVPAPFYEGMREAWDDRRVIETYRKTLAGDEKALAALTRILKQARTARTSGSRTTAADFREAAGVIRKMDEWRGELLARLAKARP